MKRLLPLGLLSALALGAFSTQAEAAPFCLRSQVIAPQCIYTDAQQCENEARRQGAVCSANPAELTLTRGVGQFCVVTSSKVSLCQYADRGSCDRDAALQHGTCASAPAVAPVGVPDPYSAVNGQ